MKGESYGTRICTTPAPQTAYGAAKAEASGRPAALPFAVDRRLFWSPVLYPLPRLGSQKECDVRLGVPLPAGRRFAGCGRVHIGGAAQLSGPCPAWEAVGFYPHLISLAGAVCVSVSQPYQ